MTAEDELRENLVELLESVPVSQRAVAEKAGFSEGYLSMLLSGDRPLRGSHARSIQEAIRKLGSSMIADARAVEVVIKQRENEESTKRLD